MTKKNTQKNSSYTYTRPQRTTLVTSLVIMVTYIILAYFATEGSFWSFAAIHTILAAITALFIWIGSPSKGASYLAVAMSAVGASTAGLLIIYYLTILSNLASS